MPPSRSSSQNAKSVLIVESPNKAKTLRQLLGRKWEVVATVGHFCDLPTKELGVDVANGFRPTYVYAPDRHDVVKTLRELGQRYEPGAIVVASDADREGEAIGWHVARTIGLRPEQVRRAEFHEITEAGVRRALASTRSLDLGLVAAQEARRILDRLVGYTLSPVVRDRLPQEHDLSAGRVQSVALRVVVDRERAIRAFVSEPFWKVEARYAWPQDARRSWVAQVVGLLNRAAPSRRDRPAVADGDEAPAALPLSRLPLSDEASANALVARLQRAPHRLARLVKREAKRHPPAPFVTSTMLQRASVRLRMSTDETTRHAKSLFEAGLVTYIRTDEPSVSSQFQAETRTWLADRYGREVLPARAPRHKAKAGANSQGAHECIRPTQLDDARTARLDGRERALYELIRETYLASQCAPAVYDVTEAWLLADELGPGDGDAEAPVVLKASGRVLRESGFLAIFGDVTAGEAETLAGSDVAPLPPLTEGDRYTPREVLPSEHWTRPPERFTEATLIKYLEERGIGRPSTFNALVAKIKQKAFVEVVDRRFLAPTCKGERLDDELRTFFSPVIKESFTAELETTLDAIAAREADWRAYMGQFWDELTPLVEAARRAPRTLYEPGDDDRASSRAASARRSRRVSTGGAESPPDDGPPRRTRRQSNTPPDSSAPPKRGRKASSKPGTTVRSKTVKRPVRSGLSSPTATDFGPPPPCPWCKDSFTRLITTKDGRSYFVCGRDTPDKRVCGFLMAAADAKGSPCPLCGAPTRAVKGKGRGCVRWRKDGGAESCAGWIKA